MESATEKAKLVDSKLYVFSWTQKALMSLIHLTMRLRLSLLGPWECIKWAATTDDELAA